MTYWALQGQCPTRPPPLNCLIHALKAKISLVILGRMKMHIPGGEWFFLAALSLPDFWAVDAARFLVVTVSSSGISSWLSLGFGPFGAAPFQTDEDVSRLQRIKKDDVPALPIAVSLALRVAGVEISLT